MGFGGALLFVSLALLAIAFLLGEAEERIFVGVQAASGLAEHSFVRGGDVATAVLIDLAVTAAVLPIALRSDKAWPLVAASLCVATLMSEAAQWLVRASPAAYSLLQSGWDLLANLLVAGAALQIWWSSRGARATAAAAEDDPDADGRS